MPATKRLPAAFVLLGLLALVAPTGVEAQDGGKLVIRELQMNGKRVTKAPLGSVVTALGSGFPSDDADGKHPAGLEVSIGGTDVMLLNAQAESVTFLIPQFDMSLGKKRLKIAVRGRGDAQIDIELMDPQKFQEEMKKLIGSDNGGGENGAPVVRSADIEDQIMASFKIGRFEFKRDATGARFEAEGTTGEVPDNFQVNLFLNINETRELESQKVTIKNKTWRCTFGPYTQQVLYGNYSLNLLFELSKQPRILAKRFREAQPPNIQAVYDRIFRREFVTVGTEQEVKDQLAGMQAHYRALCEDTTKLLLEVEKAYASGCRVFFRPDGKFVENDHSAYLQKMGFARTADELKALKEDFRFAHQNGNFKAEEYGQWATTTLVPGLQAQLQKHRDFRALTFQPVDARADMLGNYLITIVYELCREYSRVLYEKSKVPVPDFFSAVPLDPVAIPTISRPFFEAQRRLCLRTVGLGNLIPPGEGDKDESAGPPPGAGGGR